MDKIKSLISKLIEVRRSVDWLKKENNGGQYAYVSSSQVLASIREAMNDQGLFVYPNIVSHEIGNDGKWWWAHARIEYTIADTDGQEISLEWVGSGTDPDPAKAWGKLLTYAEKYFFLKLLNIPTDKDDPDRHQDAPPAPARPVANSSGASAGMTEKQRGYVMKLANDIWGPDAMICLKEVAEELGLPKFSKEYTKAQTTNLIDVLKEKLETL